MRAWTGLGAAILLACGSSAEVPSTAAAPPPPTPTPTVPVPVSAPTCAPEGDSILIAARSGPVSLLALGDAFLVAGYAERDDGGEDFWIARVSPDASPLELFRTSVAGPTTGDARPRALGSAPALARIDDTTVAIAVVGRGGEVSAGRATIEATTAHVRLVPVEEGAEALWSPTVVAVGAQLAVAWTQASTILPPGMFFLCPVGETGLSPSAPPSRSEHHDRQVRLALLDEHDIVRLRRDATPDAAGAWAEGVVAIEGASPPELVFDDPQSTLAATVHQVGVREDGFVAPRTLRTLSSLHDAAMLAAAAGPGGPWLAYMAMGADARSSVALVSLANDGVPSVLVEGNTGRMHVDAVSAGDYAVFATEGPTVRDGEPREIYVRAVGAGGPGPASRIRGSSASTSSPALAARASDALLALAYLDAGAARLRWARCR